MAAKAEKFGTKPEQLIHGLQVKQLKWISDKRGKADENAPLLWFYMASKPMAPSLLMW